MLVERVPEFTDAGYLDHTIELVVVENKAGASSLLLYLLLMH
jgi:hypothetical protein